VTVIRSAALRALRPRISTADRSEPPARQCGAPAPPGREGSDPPDALEALEASICLRARERSLGLGTLLIVAGVLIAGIVALMFHDAGAPVGLIGSGLAPVGLIGGGINLIRFGGRPPDSRRRSA
jgi:hypothetical protein